MEGNGIILLIGCPFLYLCYLAIGGTHFWCFIIQLLGDSQFINETEATFLVISEGKLAAEAIQNIMSGRGELRSFSPANLPNKQVKCPVQLFARWSLPDWQKYFFPGTPVLLFPISFRLFFFFFLLFRSSRFYQIVIEFFKCSNLGPGCI